MNNITFRIITLLSVVVLFGCSKDEDDPIIDPKDNPINEPKINTAPESLDQEFSIDENIEVEYSVGSIFATDDENDELTYELLDTDVPFTIDVTTGEILVSEDIDFETEEIYEFLVAVKDDELTTQITITIAVNDIPESSLSQEEQSRLLEMFNHIIFNKGGSSTIFTTRKWEQTINIYLTGDYTAEEVVVVDNFIVQLNELNLYDVQLDRVDSLEASNVEMWFASVEQLISDRPSFAPHITNPATTTVGVATPHYYLPSAEIFKGTVWIKSGRDDSSSTIMHEIIHIMGIGHSDDTTSLMYPQNNAGKNLSSDDVFVLEALYSEFVMAGFVEDQVKDALKAYFLTI